MKQLQLRIERLGFQCSVELNGGGKIMGPEQGRRSKGKGIQFGRTVAGAEESEATRP